MTKRLLVALDGEAQSWKALDYALEEYPEAAITGLCVITPGRPSYRVDAGNVASGEEWYAHAKADAESVCEEAAGVAAECDADFSTVTRVGRPVAEIVGYAAEHDFDGIVMGSHGRTGVSRVLLGSVAETVVRRASMPVTVVR